MLTRQNSNRWFVRNVGDWRFDRWRDMRHGPGPDRKRKAVASPGNGGNGGVTQDLAQRRYLHLQVVLFDH